MKSADPNIKLLAVGASPAFLDWNRQALETAAPEMDFLSLHVYFPGLSINVWKSDRKREYYGIMGAGRQLDEIMGRFQEQIADAGPKAANVKMALDEWNLWWSGEQIVRAEDYELSSALFMADALMRLMRKGQSVGFANYAQLVNVIGLIVSDPQKGVYVSPSYYPFVMFRNQIRGDRVLKVETDAPTFKNSEYGIVQPRKDNPYIEVAAVADENGQTLDVAVINKHYSREIPAEILLNDFGGAAECSASVVNGPSPHARNSYGSPDVVKYETGLPCEAPKDGRMERTFPAHSITLISLTR